MQFSVDAAAVIASMLQVRLRENVSENKILYRKYDRSSHQVSGSSCRQPVPCTPDILEFVFQWSLTLALEQFKIGLIQMSCGPEPDDNMRKALDRIGEAAKRGAHLVCLPELFQTQYFCQREDSALFDLAEPIPGPVTAKLSEVARRYSVVL